MRDDRQLNGRFEFAAALGDALRFFTRLPVPAGWGAKNPAMIFDGVAALSSAAGLLIGAVAGLVAFVAVKIGLPATAAAVFATAAAVALTGALHQDGLADVADGFGGGRTRERKLEIMRDSSVGAYGVSTLVLALLARVSLVAALAAHSAGGAMLAMVSAAALARPLAFAPALMLQPARTDGAGHAARPAQMAVALGAGAGLLAALVLGGLLAGLVAALAAMAAALGATALARSQIGGYTGDVCGAACEVAEIAALVAFVALMR